MRKLQFYFLLIVLLALASGSVVAQSDNFYRRFKSSQECEDYMEKFGNRLDSCRVLNAVLASFNATKQDSSIFVNFYADTLYADRIAFFAALETTINKVSDVQPYANKLIAKYSRLYKNLEQIKKDYPSTAAEYGTYHPKHITTGTCNPSCSDIGFESGTLTGWNAYYASNNSTATTMTYTGAVGGACGAVTQAAYDNVINTYHKKDDYQVEITSGAGTDPIAGALIPVVAPGGGNYSCRLGDSSVGGSRVGIIDQQFTVTAGNTALNYMYAVLIDKAPAGHTFGQQPHFIVTITDVATGDTLQCGQYIVTSSSATTGYTTVYYKIPAYGWWDSIYCAGWKSVYVSLQNYIGHCIDIQAIVSDCFPTAVGPHFCYVYFDATCGPHSIIASTPSVCGGNVILTAPAGGTYSWGGPCISGSTTGQTVTVNCSGTYTVTVTSPDGCSDTLQKVVNITPTMTVTTTSANAGCTTTGNATVTATGGTGPYVYAWSNGSTAQKDTGLTAGSYTCIVNSTGGCADTVKVTITGGGAISATIAPTNVKCFGGTGSATATPSGGTAPYKYNWNTGSTSQTLTGVAAGTYTCTVTDAGGCTTVQTVTITQPTAITTTTSETGTLCGSSTGTASVTAAGGSPGYKYSWSGGQTTSSINNLAGGSYTVTVTDANGCSTTANVNVPSTNGPTDSIVAFTNVTCFGGNNGSAEVGATGGTAPYTYAWSSGQSTTNATNLSAGNYNVTVTDHTGCIATTNVTITQPPQLRDSITASTNILCFGGNTGTATVGLKGGTAGYTYAWNNGQSSSTLTGVSAGTYTVVITDANGCKDSTPVTITQPPALTLSTTSSQVTCFGACNGQANVTAAGGTPVYSYAWSNATTTTSTNNLCPGTYTIAVTDKNGCTHDTTLTITQPNAITITKTQAPALCGQANGSASVTVSGGTPGYTYSWSNGATTSAINGVKAGNYCVTVKDVENCTDSVCFVIPNISGETVSITSITNVSCFGGNNGSATASVTGGTAPYTYAWSPTGGATTVASNLTAGIYTVTVTDSAGCSDTAIATIRQPTPVAVTSAGVTICIGQAATINASASGGTPTYTYNWTPGGTGPSITVSPITTTTYTVVATDADGCNSPPVIVVVTVNPPLSVTAGPPSTICNGGTATIGATGSGGDGIYSYLWSTGQTTSSISISPTVTTTYVVTLSDNCGTTPVQDSVIITVIPPPTVNFTADTLNGCYPLCVKFTDLSTTTTGTITSWNWSFGDGGTSSSQNDTYCYTKPGTFTVGLTVTSSNGCSASKIVPNMITVYDHPHANFSMAPQPATILDPTIYFTDHSTDLYGIQSWFWTFGDNTDSTSTIKDPQHTYQDTGYYCAHLVVTNIHQCIDSTTNCIEIEPYYTLYVPNAFTPNGNGLNDLFTAKGVGIKKFEMWIFDRWGMLLYHCTNMDAGWDGTVQNTSGQLCQEDTYVWLIEAEDVFNHQHRLIGRVTLIK